MVSFINSPSQPAIARALLLINRHARRGKQIKRQVVQQLQRLGIEVLPVKMPPPHHLPNVIRQYQSQVDAVIIGGGDGTLNAALQGLVDTHLPLGILPLGTANDLARTLGIPPSIPHACRIIAAGQQRTIDLGWVNGHYFFNVASFGLSVQITHCLTHQVKRRWGVLAYAIAALQAISQARPLRAEIVVDEQVITTRTLQIAVGNGRYYGGGMTVVHDAAIDDQRLDLYSLEIAHWWQILALFPLLRWGFHIRQPGVRTLHGQEFTIHTRRHYPINTDGEITTTTPAHFRLLPKALTVFAPTELTPKQA